MPGSFIINAVIYGNDSLIEGMFNHGHGVDINAVDTMGRTALHIAVARNKLNTVRILCNCSTDVVFLEHKNTVGLTALHIAVKECRVPIVQLLLNAGGNVTTVDINGRTPLHDAVHASCVPIIATLLAHGAGMHVRDLEGYTPLLYSAEMPAEVFISLTNHNSIRRIDRHKKNFEDQTILHLAFHHSNSDLLELLLYSRLWDVNTQDNNGDTLLHYACRDGRSRVVRLLLRNYRAYSALENSDGLTPLDLATQHVVPTVGAALGPVRHTTCVDLLGQMDQVNRNAISQFSFANASSRFRVYDDMMRMVFRYL